MLPPVRSTGMEDELRVPSRWWAVVYLPDSGRGAEQVFESAVDGCVLVRLGSVGAACVE